MTPLLHFPERRVAALRLPRVFANKWPSMIRTRVISNPVATGTSPTIGLAGLNDSTVQLGAASDSIQSVNNTSVSLYPADLAGVDQLFKSDAALDAGERRSVRTPRGRSLSCLRDEEVP